MTTQDYSPIYYTIMSFEGPHNFLVSVKEALKTIAFAGPRNEETGIEPEFWEEVNIHEPEDPTSVFFKQL